MQSGFVLFGQFGFGDNFDGKGLSRFFVCAFLDDTKSTGTKFLAKFVNIGEFVRGGKTLNLGGVGGAIAL